MSTPAPANFNIIPPQEPLVNPKTGIINRSWWRFFNSVFALLGGYQGGGGGGTPVNLTALATLAYSEAGPSGPDFTSSIREIQTMLADVPDPAGRIAQLEARVNQLETILADMSLPPDLVAIRRQLDFVTAYSMGGP